MHDTTQARHKTGIWLLTALWLFGLAWGVYAIVQDIDGLLWDAHLETAGGYAGAIYDQADNTGPGFVAIIRLDPDGPMARAGAAVGDHVRFDRVSDVNRTFRAGEYLGLTVNHAGQMRHVAITAIPRPVRGPFDKSLLSQDSANNLSCLVMAVFGLFMLWRGRRNLTTILLGLGLITYGMATALPSFSLSAPQIYPWAFLLGSLNYGSIPILFYAFAMRFYSDNIAAPKRWEYALFAVYGVAQMVFTMVLMHFLYTFAALPVVGNGYDSSTLISWIGFIAAFAYLFVGWRRSTRESQQRYAIMLIAISAIIVCQAIAGAMFFLSVVPKSMVQPLGFTSAILSGIVAPILFSYAIFRHRVLDLGFAINRTLVYGVVSAILLVVFGVLEWAFEHFLPFESHEASVFVDAGIALAVFLVFHRVRDFVEHHIEKLFFHKWHQKEAEMNRFTAEAGFILKSEALIPALVDAVRRFSEAECALYVTDSAGNYIRAGGHLDGVGERLDADDPFLVTLRADRTAHTPNAGAIALALPMIQRTEVVGVVLLGRKASGFAYRPDEKALLAHVAHQVGLDLHALRIEQLEAEAVALKSRAEQSEIRYAELEKALSAFGKA